MSQPTSTAHQAPRAVLLAADTDDSGWSSEESLSELTRLAATAGIDVVGQTIQKIHDAHPNSYLGKGKVREVKDEKSSLRFDTIVADDELSAVQQRYLEEVLDVQVLDRTAVILHIFAQHARTREGRLQVELAQYRYRLPRLTGRGADLSRLGAGINTRGPGETKLETDRRRMRQRIGELEREIERVRQTRSLQRQQRRLSGIPVIALVGYTNAGKSTLMNRLTGAHVFSSDLLFATLDPTTRRHDLANGQEVLFTDTVGFIQKLPTDLVAAFRATLEEITEADLILHVVDASHPQADEQAEAVEDELEELGVRGKRRITAMNKVDLISHGRLEFLSRLFEDPVCISALEGTGIDVLEQCLVEEVSAEFVPLTVCIPYGDADLINLFRSRGTVEREDHEAAGTLMTGRVPAGLVSTFKQYLT